MRLRRWLCGVGVGALAAAACAQPGISTGWPVLAGDPERGRLVFGPCRACHFTVAELGHGNGPNLFRIFGRVAGSQPDFAYYSPQMQAAQFVWTPQMLFAWLENPMAALPGTSMMSAGVPDARERADLIAYLQLVTVQIAD